MPRPRLICSGLPRRGFSFVRHLAARRPAPKPRRFIDGTMRAPERDARSGPSWIRFERLPEAHCAPATRRRLPLGAGGIQHVAAKPETIGYSDILRPKTTSAVHVAPGAAAFLDSRPAEPFFLDVVFSRPTANFISPRRKIIPNYIQPPVPYPTRLRRGSTWLLFMPAQESWTMAWDKFWMPWSATALPGTRW